MISVVSSTLGSWLPREVACVVLPLCALWLLFKCLAIARAVEATWDGMVQAVSGAAEFTWGCTRTVTGIAASLKAVAIMVLAGGVFLLASAVTLWSFYGGMCVSRSLEDNEHIDVLKYSQLVCICLMAEICGTYYAIDSAEEVLAQVKATQNGMRNIRDGVSVSLQGYKNSTRGIEMAKRSLQMVEQNIRDVRNGFKYMVGI